MKPVLTLITALLRNKWFWIALAVVVLILIARKYIPEVKRLLKPDRTDYSDEPQLTDADKQRLDRLAADLFAEFDGITWSTEVFDLVSALNDRELKYLANVFPHYSNGETLRGAIQDEAIIGDADNLLIARLNNMAE